jgi:hypothetical protein
MAVVKQRARRGEPTLASETVIVRGDLLDPDLLAESAEGNFAVYGASHALDQGLLEQGATSPSRFDPGVAHDVAHADRTDARIPGTSQRVVPDPSSRGGDLRPWRRLIGAGTPASRSGAGCSTGSAS